MIKTLKLIADQYGIGILRDGNKLLAYYADLAPLQKRELQMLLCLVKCDGNKKLLDVVTKPREDQQHCVILLVNELTSQLLISEDVAFTICDSFLQAIGGFPIPKNQLSHTPPETTQEIIQQSGEAFQKENGTEKAPRKLSSIIVPTCILVITMLLLIPIFLRFTPTTQANSANSLIQANLTNWGYAVSVPGKVYYSDGRSGIYRLVNETEKELWVTGCFSDMALLGDTIFCVERIHSEYENNDKPVIVGIDISTGAKNTIYLPTSPISQLIGINVIDDRFYFTVDNDALFSVNEAGTVENTGLRYAKKVTQSGVYTTETASYGLKLLSFDGTTVKNYPTLSGYEVNVYFEMGDWLYLGYQTGDDNKIYRMDKNSGKTELLPNSDQFFSGNILSYVNYLDGVFYISTSVSTENGAVRYKVYTMDSTGDNIQEIHSELSEPGGLPFCTINLADQYLFINFPISNLPSKIISLDSLVK